MILMRLRHLKMQVVMEGPLIRILILIRIQGTGSMIILIRKTSKLVLHYLNKTTYRGYLLMKSQMRSMLMQIFTMLTERNKNSNHLT